MHWFVFFSFLFQEVAPKEASRECGFIFDKDWVHSDLLSKAFTVSQKVEAHLFIHVRCFNTTRLCCCAVQEVPCHISIFGTHPMRAVGNDLVHGVPFNRETHLFIRHIPKVALTCVNDSMSV